MYGGAYMQVVGRQVGRLADLSTSWQPIGFSERMKPPIMHLGSNTMTFDPPFEDQIFCTQIDMRFHLTGFSPKSTLCLFSVLSCDVASPWSPLYYFGLWLFL